MNLKQLRELAERATPGTRLLHVGFDRFSTKPGCYGAYIEVGDAYNFLASAWSDADKSLYCTLDRDTVLALLDSIGEMADALKGYAELDKQPTYIGELVYTKSLGAEARNALEAHRRRFE